MGLWGFEGLCSFTGLLGSLSVSWIFGVSRVIRVSSVFGVERVFKVKRVFIGLLKKFEIMKQFKLFNGLMVNSVALGMSECQRSELHMLPPREMVLQHRGGATSGPPLSPQLSMLSMHFTATVTD